MDPDYRTNLEHALQTNLENIMRHYASFVDFIHRSIQSKGIDVSTLRIYLLSLSAFSADGRVELLSDVKPELEKAATIGEIFILLAKCTSFLNYKIYWCLADNFKIEDSLELKYPEFLKNYIEMHRISEFICFNPTLEKMQYKSQIMVLKLDIETTCVLAKITDLRSAVAKILGLNMAALKIISIEEGCVMVTFLIPNKAAEILFVSDRLFSQNDIKQFRSCSVLWLECNGCRYDFHGYNIKGNA
jgi:hypothetical protein